MNGRNIAVIGGGISGLTAGYVPDRLTRRLKGNSSRTVGILAAGTAPTRNDGA